MYDIKKSLHRPYIDNLNVIIQVVNAFEIIQNTYVRIYYFKSEDNGTMNYEKNIDDMIHTDKYGNALTMGIFGGLEYLIIYFRVDEIEKIEQYLDMYDLILFDLHPHIGESCSKNIVHISFLFYSKILNNIGWRNI